MNQNLTKAEGGTRLSSDRRDAHYLCKACLGPVKAVDLVLQFGQGYHREHVPRHPVRVAERTPNC